MSIAYHKKMMKRREEEERMNTHTDYRPYDDPYDRRLKARNPRPDTKPARCECGSAWLPTGGYACAFSAREKYYSARKAMERRDRRKEKHLDTSL